jgi:thymidylate synthase (FAD)
MKIELLDHGYVEFVEAWGHGKAMVAVKDGDGWDNEVGIVEAARQSTQGSFRGWETDEKLLQHLYENRHGTPFEFAGMIVEIQAPIFVFREWHRHRTQSYNEMSARYAPLPGLYYKPDISRILIPSSNNKQASSTGAIAGEVEAVHWRNALAEYYKAAEALYAAALQDGIPKELSRLSMPVGHYSRMRASASLRNWLAFMTLRCDPLAQWEIRQFAWSIAKLIKEIFPRTYNLWSREAIPEMFLNSALTQDNEKNKPSM